MAARAVPERAVDVELRRRRKWRLASIGVFCAGLGALGIVVVASRDRRRSSASEIAAPQFDGEPPAPSGDAWGQREGDRPATLIAARRLNRAAGVLAFSVMTDSALEHYRGDFANPAMFIPPVVSALTLAVSAHGLADGRSMVHGLRHTTYATAALTGLAGTAFHLWNVGKRPGGFSWHNLFYAAPLGAPGAIALAGLLGYYGERVRAARPGSDPRLLGLPAGRMLAGLTGGGLLATTAEVWLLHFRGAFHNPAMFIPVTLPPMTSAMLVHAALAKKNVDRWPTRWALRATTIMGFAGVGFHAFGIARNMGGWRNWTQNLQSGPPLPAPPSFTGLALAGLAALGLMRDHPDA